MGSDSSNFRFFFLGILVSLGIVSLGYWLFGPETAPVSERVPIPENFANPRKEEVPADANMGTLIRGSGKPGEDTGRWPQFRGPNRDGIAEGVPIADVWPEEGPKVLWKIQVGEGHAGAAVYGGCVYLLDYDAEKKEDVIRCLSLNDAAEIWRYTYYVKLKRNHGMSRTVPAVSGEYVVTLGPKCHVHCLNAKTGEPVWKKDLVEEYEAMVPEWYAGQCPLIEGDRVILAPGGSCLMMAVDLATGNVLWETPNDRGWRMTHASITPIEFNGRRQYVWCASDGAVGVDGETGELLWTLPEWKIRIATIPSPLDLGNGKILLTGGYNAGSTMIRLEETGGKVVPKILFHTEAKTFGSDQQTPIFYDGLVFGIIPRGKLACLSPEGERLWVNDEYDFGLGPYIMIDGKLLVLDDNDKSPGELCLFRVDAEGAEKLAGWRVLEGHDAWAPIAFAGGRVILRDLTTMICLDLTGS